jgi:hypothetical protein
MLVSELLNEGIILEKLGNLAKLNVGSMINILKQKFSQGSGSGRRASYDRASQTGKRFGGGDRDNGYWYDREGFGDTSEVIDVSLNRKIPLIAAVRRAYKEHEDAIAFALYVDGKAVCFGKYTAETLGGSARVGGLAYDFTIFKDQLDKQHADALADHKEKKRWGQEPQPRKLSSHKEEEHDSWTQERRKRDGKAPLPPKVFHGEAKATGNLKEILEEIEQLAGSRKITCKLVLSDKKGMAKRGERSKNRPVDQSDLMKGLGDLKTRLAKYKIAKKPTADTIEGFLEATLKGIKVIQFAGQGYSTTPDVQYGQDKINPISLLNGKPFHISYKNVEPGHSSDSVDVYYIFDKETGKLEPWKASWRQKGSYETITAALKPDTYLHQELGVKSKNKDEQKDEILKHILTKFKASPASAKQLIKTARAAGHDYPEFKAIEKSLAASETK